MCMFINQKLEVVWVLFGGTTLQYNTVDREIYTFVICVKNFLVDRFSQFVHLQNFLNG